MAIRSISAAYFVGEILIPNISGSSITEQANLLPLNLAIAIHEPLYLERLLGEDLYNAYAAGIAEGTPAEKWVTLNNKIYYTNAALTALSTGISPVAYYVYFYFMKNAASITLLGQEAKGTHENFTDVGSAHKMVHAWNRMVKLSEDIQEYLEENTDTYPEYLDRITENFNRINLYGI